MKKALLFVTVSGIMALSACARKTCPAYQSQKAAPVSSQPVRA